MSGYDFYVLLICLIVLCLIAGLSTLLLGIAIKQSIKLIRCGVEDDKLKVDYVKEQNKKGGRIDFILSLALCIILVLVFAFSLWVNFREHSYSEKLPTLKVVQSESMSKKHDKNIYLYANDLDDQFRMFDIILTYKAPAEEDLKLYDVVVYKVKDAYVVHRIIGIEEPNAVHPNERYFLCRGDYNEVSDKFPVTYDQIIGIYRGECIPFVGSFVLFMQSPAGYLCILLVIAAVVLTPILEKRIKREANGRLVAIGFIDENGEIIKTTEVAVAEDVDAFGHLKGKKDDRTFDERIEDSTIQTKDRYQTVNSLIERVVGLKKRSTDKIRSYYVGNTTLIKLVVKGKTLNVYLALDPKEYENTKYVFTDASDVKKYASTPMRIRLSSDRQAKWANELIEALVTKKGLTIAKEPIKNIFDHLANVNEKSFKQKLKGAPEETKERYKTITSFINGLEQLKLGQGKKTVSYKYKNKTVIKMAIRGKTLNVYLALDPKAFENTKYKFLDVSAVKKFQGTPMRVKVSSQRQTKWTIELIAEMAKNSLKI